MGEAPKKNNGLSRSTESILSIYIETLGLI